MFRSILLIGMGGFIGTVLRFLTGRFFQFIIHSSFPFGTFIVNVTGSLLIGFFFGLFDRGGLQSQDWRLFLTIGICGGFTTFSSFASENFIMLREGQVVQFFVYTSTSIILGLLAVWLGYLITKIL